MEVITACENVCRDYYWLWSIDPRIFQGFLTVAAACIASGTALWIAYKAYPEQKKIDRENDRLKDRRFELFKILDDLVRFDEELKELAKMPMRLSKYTSHSTDYPYAQEDFFRAAEELIAAHKNFISGSQLLSLKISFWLPGEDGQKAISTYFNCVWDLANSWGELTSFKSLESSGSTHISEAWSAEWESRKEELMYGLSLLYSSFASDIQGAKVKFSVSPIIKDENSFAE